MLVNSEVTIGLLLGRPGANLVRAKTSAVSYLQKLLSSHLRRKTHWYIVCAIKGDENPPAEILFEISTTENLLGALPEICRNR